MLTLKNASSLAIVVFSLIAGGEWGLASDQAQSTMIEMTPGVQLVSRQSTSIYDFTLNDIDGKPLQLNHLQGKVLLLVNTASFCGNTPQYEQLQAMYDTYHEKGFEILAFPANNFGQQEPGTNEEIKTFCHTKYSLTFPLFSKISVKGADKHPLYRYLTEQSPFPGAVEWNFQKYLVDRSGKVVARYHHRTKPLSDEIIHDVERTLSEN